VSLHQSHHHAYMYLDELREVLFSMSISDSGYDYGDAMKEIGDIERGLK